MTKRVCLMVCALVGSLAISTAAAQESPLYFGFKAGRMETDVGGFDAASNFGFTFGYELLRDFNGSFALEGEYTRDLAKGDVAGAGNWKIETLAGYGAYRTADTVYLKAKSGLLRRDATVRGADAGFAGRDSEISFGAGVGVRLTQKTGLELEYTVIESAVSFLSLGYFTHF